MWLLGTPAVHAARVRMPILLLGTLLLMQHACVPSSLGGFFAGVLHDGIIMMQHQAVMWCVMYRVP